MRRQGFTLIELLVVIAIIAILAAILFPVFAKAREKARQTSCLSNVKQIMLGILSYAQDYDETLPPYRWVQSGIPSVWVDRDNSAATNRHFWMEAIEPYLKNTQILFCPSQGTYSQSVTNAGRWYPNYAMNGNCSYASLGAFGDASSKIVIGDIGMTDSSRTPPGYLENWFINTYPSNTWMQYSWWSEIHNGGGNYAFLDGHAKWLGATSGALGPIVATGSSLTGDQTGSWMQDN